MTPDEVVKKLQELNTVMENVYWKGQKEHPEKSAFLLALFTGISLIQDYQKLREIVLTKLNNMINLLQIEASSIFISNNNGDLGSEGITTFLNLPKVAILYGEFIREYKSYGKVVRSFKKRNPKICDVANGKIGCFTAMGYVWRWKSELGNCRKIPKVGFVIHNKSKKLVNGRFI